MSSSEEPPNQPSNPVPPPPPPGPSGGPDLSKPRASDAPPPYQPPPPYDAPPPPPPSGWGQPSPEPGQGSWYPNGPGMPPPPGAPGGIGGPGWQPPSGQEMQREAVGFLGALFDFGFNHFVTPMIIKVVYIIATVALVLGWLAFLIGAFATSAAFGLFVLIIGPIFVILYLALIRMTLEFYLAVVRMSEDIHQRLR